MLRPQNKQTGKGTLFCTVHSWCVELLDALYREYQNFAGFQRTLSLGDKSRKTQQYHLRHEVPTPQITRCWDCLQAKLSLGAESYRNFKFRIVEVWLWNILKWQMISMDINTPFQGTTSI